MPMHYCTITRSGDARVFHGVTLYTPEPVPARVVLVEERGWQAMTLPDANVTLGGQVLPEELQALMPTWPA